MAANEKTLRLILGDQLNSAHSWFKRWRLAHGEVTSFCLTPWGEKA
jgi:hypothetical protein